MSRFGNDAPEHREQSAKALATVLHLHRGTPYVYQGDELGMSNVGYTSIDQLRDIESLNQYAAAVAAGGSPAEVMGPLRAKSRDNARTPMQWDASPTAGFTEGVPWLDLHPDAATVNAAAQVDDPDSVFAHFRRLIALRHAEPAVAHGSFRMLLADDKQVYAFVRELDATRLLVVANLSDTAGVVPDLTEAGSLAGAEPLVLSLPASPASATCSRSGAGRPARPLGVEGLPPALTLGCPGTRSRAATTRTSGAGVGDGLLLLGGELLLAGPVGDGLGVGAGLAAAGDRGEHDAVAALVEQGEGPGQVAAHVAEGVVPDHGEVAERVGALGAQRGHLLAQAVDVLGQGVAGGAPTGLVEPAQRDDREDRGHQGQHQSDGGDHERHGQQASARRVGNSSP